MGIIFLEIAFILLLSAFFSGMEIAFVSSNKLRYELEKSSQNFTSKVLDIFYEHPNNFISTLLVGNNIALVVYGILMARVLDFYLLEPLGLGQYEGMMKIFAFPAFIFYIVLYPVSELTSGLSRLFLRLIGLNTSKDQTEQAFTKVDLDYFIQSSIDSTSDKEEINEEVKIFQNALEFSNVKVRDCIVPRTEIQAIDRTASLEDLKNLFVESGKSKIIVYDGDIDHIVGFIHSSELFKIHDQWQGNIREVPIVPETMQAQKLLKTFMQQKKSLAVIVDEFGGTSGIVTMEDLVEEIFGDIEDEHDTSNYVAKKLEHNEYIISARLEIEKANELLDLDLPESDDYQTVGGLILHQYQSFPKLNEVVSFGKYEFKIIKNTMTKIELVRLKIVE